MPTPSLFAGERLLQRRVHITALALCSFIGAMGQIVWRTKCVTPSPAFLTARSKQQATTCALVKTTRSGCRRPPLSISKARSVGRKYTLEAPEFTSHAVRKWFTVNITCSEVFPGCGQGLFVQPLERFSSTPNQLWFIWSRGPTHNSCFAASCPVRKRRLKAWLWRRMCVRRLTLRLLSHGLIEKCLFRIRY